jgi:hypothetical protein
MRYDSSEVIIGAVALGVCVGALVTFVLLVLAFPECW